jgi:MFS family permease
MHIPSLPVLCVLVLMLGFTVNGISPGCYALAAHFYPTSIRATGVSWATGVGRLGAITSAGAGSAMLAAGWTFSEVFMFLPLPLVAGALALYCKKQRRAIANSLGQVMSRDNDGMTTMKINEALKTRYRQQGYWGDATLADYWHLSAKASADKIAVSDNHGTAYTYRELDNAAGALAMWLVENSIQPGDRVALQLPGWCEFTVIYLACLKCGAVVVPLLPAFRESELAWIMNKCQARILFTATRYKNVRPIQMLPRCARCFPGWRR